MSLKLLTGAAIGGLSQDPLDHPIAGILGSGIGAATAYYSSYSKVVSPFSKKNAVFKYDSSMLMSKQFDRQNLSDKVTGLNSKLKKAENLVVSISGWKQTRNNVKKLDRAINHVDRLKSRIEILQHNVLTLASARGVTLPAELGSNSNDYLDNLSKFIMGSDTEEKAISAISNARKLDTKIQLVDAADNKFQETLKTVHINSTSNKANSLNILSSHFINQLGYGKEEATRKAGLLLHGLHGTDFVVKGSTLIAQQNGVAHEIPLTVQNKGGSARFAKIGDTLYASKPINPFGRLYANGQAYFNEPLLKDIMGSDNISELIKTKMAPEDIIGFMEKKDGKVNIADWYEKTMKQMQYVAADSPLAYNKLGDLTSMPDNKFSEYMRRLSGASVYFEDAIEIKDDGLMKLNKIKSISENGSASEMSNLLRRLGNEFAHEGYNPLAGQGLNTVGYFSALDFKNLALDDAFVPTMERATDVVTGRGYIEEPGARLGAGNEKIVSRVDIDSGMSSYISKLFGGHVSIADGAGLINEESLGRLSEKQHISLEIAKGENGLYPIIHEELAKAMSESDLTKRQAMLENIKLGANDVVGFDKLGKESRIGNVYTGGIIKSAWTNNSALKINVEASFDASTQRWLKLFGTSSKAGYTSVTDSQFKAISTMENLRRSGIISFDSSASGYSIDEKSKGFKDYVLELRRKRYALKGYTANADVAKLQINSLMTSGNIDGAAKHLVNRFGIAGDIMLGAKDSGADALYDHNKLIQTLTDANKLNEKGLFGNAVKILQDAKSDELSKTKASIFIQSQMDFKGNSDLFVTLRNLASKNNDTKGLQDLDNLRGGRLLVENRDVAENALRSVIDRNVKSMSDVAALQTRVVADLGEGLHGIGNVGSMSWLERKQLKASGWTDDMLGVITRPSADAAFELRMIQSMAAIDKEIPDNIKATHGNQIVDSFDFIPENRKNALKGALTAQGDFLSYNLSTPEEYGNKGGKIKSVPISFLTTNRTGHLQVGEADILSKLDKKRRDLIKADLEYINAEPAHKKAYAARYMDVLSQVEEMHVRLLKGDGNIAKAASKSTVDGSSFMRARSVGGNFASFMESGAAKNAGAAYSKATIYGLAERMGIDSKSIHWEDVGHGGIQQAMIKDKKGNIRPLRNMWTREPSQGAFSIISGDAYFDPSAQLGKDEVGFAHNSNKNIFEKGQFTDYDYDTIRVTGIDFKNPEHKKMFEAMMATQNKAFDESQHLMDAMASKQKNGAINPKSFLGDYNSAAAYYADQATSSFKGRQRKILAAPATYLAMNMTDMLIHRLDSDTTLSAEERMSRSITGRTVIHNITESLIKSAHRSNEDIRRTMGVSEIETLQSAYKKLLGGNTREYREQTKQALENLLGNKVKSFAEGKRAEGHIDLADNIMKNYNQGISDVIEGTVEFAHQIERSGARIKDARDVHSFDKMIEYLQTMANANMIESEELAANTEARIKSIGQRGSDIFHAAKRNMYKNRMPLSVGAAALAATAMFVGGETPEMTKEAVPFSTSDGILGPLQSENAPTYKKSGYGQTTNINGQSKRDGQKVSNLQRTLFGDKGGSRTNVNIRDKREQRY